MSNQLDAQAKEEQVRRILRTYNKVLVAFSGGVDSTYLAHLAYEELGDGLLCVLSDSSGLPGWELERARSFLSTRGWCHRIIQSGEMDDPTYTANIDDRCFRCKTHLFARLARIAAEKSIDVVMDGENADDQHEHRPGRLAAEQSGVIRPLARTGMTKAEIRERSAALGLPEPHRPATACLATRIAFGTQITWERLTKVEKMEDLLRELGFSLFRARYDEKTIRIEVEPMDIPKAASAEVRERICLLARELDVPFISLDLEGYGSGKMNRMLRKPTK